MKGMGNAQGGNKDSAGGEKNDAVTGAVDHDAYEKLCAEYDKKTTATQVYAEEAIRLHADGKLLVIDTRESYEHEYATIPNARLLSPTSMGMTLVSTVGTGMGYKQEVPVEELKAVPEDVTIICSCTAGLRSGYCAVDLSKRLERPVLNLHGGIISWFNAGGKVVNPKTNEAVDKIHTYGESWSKFVKEGKGVFKL